MTVGNRAEAAATLSRVQGGRQTYVINAVDGTVAIESRPADVSAWKEGQHLIGRFLLEFPERNLKQVGCEGATSEDGGTGQECTCEDDNGIQSKCQAANGVDCCFDAESPRHRLELQFDATPCPYLCAATSDTLAQYCAELL